MDKSSLPPSSVKGLVSERLISELTFTSRSFLLIIFHVLPFLTILA